ncbi:acetyltransferase (GNAT) family protein [Thiogranum longum]|uniref:Acetyltransferase (GNAT) family protein n=1 Tax=Thiogranum longum TaxID=1537524 RepID=A0A4V2PGW7_9GAMM|nr:GNAT family N-acetyltransferase [Thiogranum longum]TCK18416.1 acetyltransferase (GNAT) family protein [Thiogranum longum]
MTIIRSFDSNEARLLRDLAVQNYAEQYGDVDAADGENPARQAYVSHILQIQESGKGVVLVAVQDDSLIGFVCLLKPETTAAENGSEDAYAYMSDLYVVPEHRKKGAGSLLIREGEARASEMGATRIALRVTADNEEARRFYSKAEYQEKFVVMSKVVGEG